jgi:hypothetical protein
VLKTIIRWIVLKSRIQIENENVGDRYIFADLGRHKENAIDHLHQGEQSAEYHSHSSFTITPLS